MSCIGELREALAFKKRKVVSLLSLDILAISMIRYVIFLVCIGLALGASFQSREKRQVACTEPVVTNVCQQGLNGPLHFPHPTDKTKFLQCAPGGRMFIIKCPDNEVYDQGTTSCGLLKPVVTMPPPTLPPQTVAPVTQAPVSNPCTAQNIANGNIFFPYPGDVSRFIECTSPGQSLTLACPTRLVYNAAKQGCILPAGSTVNTGGSTQTGTGSTTNTGTGSGTGTGTVVAGGNPCAAAMTANKELFFPHPDPTKFFQCDLAGNAFIKQCPANLVWNQSISRCDTPYNLAQTQNVG